MFEEVSLNRDEWRNSSTSKPSKLVTVTGCRESMGKWHHDMPQHSAILRSPSHTPGLCPLGTNEIPSQIDVRDALVDLQVPRPRPGNRDRSRLASSSRALPFKSWSLKSGEHMTFNSDMWISLIQNLANNAEIDSCLQHLHIRQLSLRWQDEWWNYSTSKPSKLVTVKGCGKHMKTYENRSIQRWALPSKPDHWNPENKYMQIWKNTFNSNMWISLMRNLANNGNQPRNPHFHSPSTCSKKSPRSTMNDETPAPPNHPNLSLSQDAGKVWESDIMTCRSIQRFCGAHPTHQALAPSAPIWLFVQIDVRDGRVCLQRLGQGLETETDQGWRLHPGLYRSNRDHWNPENTWHLTLTCESLWYRTLANNAESDSCLQHLHIWQLSLRWKMND